MSPVSKRNVGNSVSRCMNPCSIVWSCYDFSCESNVRRVKRHPFMLFVSRCERGGDLFRYVIWRIKTFSIAKRRILGFVFEAPSMDSTPARVSSKGTHPSESTLVDGVGSTATSVPKNVFFDPSQRKHKHDVSIQRRIDACHSISIHWFVRDLFFYRSCSRSDRVRRTYRIDPWTDCCRSGTIVLFETRKYSTSHEKQHGIDLFHALVRESFRVSSYESFLRFSRNQEFFESVGRMLL